MNSVLEKKFDAVAWVRGVRDHMYEEQKSWTEEKLISHLNSFAGLTLPASPSVEPNSKSTLIYSV